MLYIAFTVSSDIQIYWQLSSIRCQSISTLSIICCKPKAFASTLRVSKLEDFKSSDRVVNQNEMEHHRARAIHDPRFRVARVLTIAPIIEDKTGAHFLRMPTITRRYVSLPLSSVIISKIDQSHVSTFISAYLRIDA